MVLQNKREAKSAESRRAILNSMRYIIRKYSPKELTVRNICEESGLSTGTFYYHFKTKENVVSIYMAELFKEAMERNSMPEYVEKSYFGKVLWPFLVYSKFCEHVGKEYTQLFMLNIEYDPFYHHCFIQNVSKDIHELFEDMIGGVRGVKYEDIYDDFKHLYRGVIVCWCMEDESVTVERRSMCSNMEHLLMRFMLSFAPEEIHDSIKFGSLITEQEDFERYINMDFMEVNPS